VPRHRGSDRRPPVVIDPDNEFAVPIGGSGNTLQSLRTGYDKGLSNPAPLAPTADTRQGAAPSSGAGGSGGGGGQFFNGFNFSQDAANRDPNKSAKYAFSDFAGAHAGSDKRWMGLNGREEMTAYFNEYIRPGMEALGYTILAVDGDKVQIAAREGTGWVDWVENAGIDQARLAWQDLGPTPDGASMGYTSQGMSGGGAAPGAGGGLYTGGDPLQNLGGVNQLLQLMMGSEQGNSAFLENIQQQLAEMVLRQGGG
jgi:hypothetical protein